MNHIRRYIGRWIAGFLTQEMQTAPALPVDIAVLTSLLHKGDVILVEGNLRVSAVIKYLTQSTWSHAVLYAGDGVCIEADMLLGVRRFSVAELENYHLRVCRPISLTVEDADIIIAHAESRLGMQYDLKHVFDLARYMLPLPVPSAWRRRAIAVGSADPSRAICSTLVAEAFQAVRYPILPEITTVMASSRAASAKMKEIYHIHDTGLFTPRDFDISPYFHVIKPDMPRPFDHHNLIWAT
ncbi:C40 family peptidase [Acidocella aminolytica]|jgi:hypothetical protein|uniref:Lipo-like protein n=1 Tax=Acidocella aminolytica 101 = DSM 11237 TaxID=1120923 RepID=A0A0D6PH68_9PROT|nr:lipo-like protein [Acidocella aminolytica]GAN80164.1 hypothetical protein Aam_039_046 [Acidocella aminolytica 101 = DSM 11237]GBQ33410.1 hypothetical protein AA11237_0437 [Acidocella aminolytica 101 = DSM 11237]SHE88226.1 Permuted papain-like amidase enzyme, YaeF/YiiX, C92 family [Acidocella aminolytica 101 = DSM 11237]